MANFIAIYVALQANKEWLSLKCEDQEHQAFVRTIESRNKSRTAPCQDTYQCATRGISYLDNQKQRERDRQSIKTSSTQDTQTGTTERNQSQSQ